MWLKVAVLCAMLGAFPALAEEPKGPSRLKSAMEELVITGPTKVDPYKLARFKVSNVPVGYTILWDVYPIENVDPATQKVRSVYEFVAPPGSYRVRVRAFKGEDDFLEGWQSFVIGDGGSVVPPVKPPVKPVDPPVTPTETYYFVIVRPDGPASPAFTKTMNLPEWATLKAKGHVYKDKTLTAAKNDLGLEIPEGVVLPTVVTLVVKDGSSTIVRGPTLLPSDGEGILKLPEGIK